MQTTTTTTTARRYSARQADTAIRTAWKALAHPTPDVAQAWELSEDARRSLQALHDSGVYTAADRDDLDNLRREHAELLDRIRIIDAHLNSR